VLSLIGLIGGLALLSLLIFKNINIIITSIVCSLFVALFSSMNLYDAVVGTYMKGFTGFLGNYFMVFLTGTIFGKMMELTGAAQSVANAIVNKFGAEKALIAGSLACGVLVYGGVSAHVIGFSVYPLVLTLFKAGNLPRRFTPAVLAFGTITFAMVAPGSPQIHNIIPGQSLGTTPMAGTVVGFISIIVMFILGWIYLQRAVRKAVANGEHFIERPSDAQTIPELESLPSPIISAIPLVIVVVALNALHFPLEVAIMIGTLVGGALMWKYLGTGSRILGGLSNAASSALTAMANTAAVVGFGQVASSTPAFGMVLDSLTNVPGSPLIGAAIAVTVMAGLAGSASGGMAIVLPLLAPIYGARGVDFNALHRTAVIASGCLDSLPHNGYVVTTTNVICGETHKDAYPAVGMLTVVIPAIGTALAIVLFSLFPNLP